MAKNLMGKTVARSEAYEVWENTSGWTWYVRKFYKSQTATALDPYGRVFCDVTSPFSPTGDTGDVYYADITGHARLVQTNYPEALDRA